MNIEMTANEWMSLIVLGGILGMVGQGIRIIIGLKKLNDTAYAEGSAFKELFEVKSITLSLLIGFVAGALGIIGITLTNKTPHLTTNFILTIVGAGYAGTDFIEGFISKYLPRKHTALSHILKKVDLQPSPKD